MSEWKHSETKWQKNTAGEYSRWQVGHAEADRIPLCWNLDFRRLALCAYVVDPYVCWIPTCAPSSGMWLLLKSGCICSDTDGVLYYDWYSGHTRGPYHDHFYGQKTVLQLQGSSCALVQACAASPGRPQTHAGLKRGFFLCDILSHRSLEVQNVCDCSVEDSWYICHFLFRLLNWNILIVFGWSRRSWRSVLLKLCPMNESVTSVSWWKGGDTERWQTAAHGGSLYTVVGC